MISTMEIAEKAYSLMIEMAEKGKKVRFEATRDTSYLNVKDMVTRGLCTVVEEVEDEYQDTGIKMNNMVIEPNGEKLEEELKKTRETLKRLERRITQDTIEGGR